MAVLVISDETVQSEGNGVRLHVNALEEAQFEEKFASPLLARMTSPRTLGS